MGEEYPIRVILFQAQIFDKLSNTFGISTARNVSDTMKTLVYSKDMVNQQVTWNRVVSLANAGKVAAALGLLEHIFQEGFTLAGKRHGWADEIPNAFKKFYARKFLLPVWLETPQVEEVASAGVKDRKHSVNDVVDAFARIRDYMQTPTYLRSYRNQTRQFLKTNPSDRLLSSGLVSTMEAMRKYLLQPKSSEGIVTNFIPPALVDDAVLGQHQSIPAGWLDQFQNHLAGIAEKDFPVKAPKERYATITYDRKLKELLERSIGTSYV